MPTPQEFRIIKFTFLVPFRKRRKKLMQRVDPTVVQDSCLRGLAAKMTAYGFSLSFTK
ncbi:hypothetical protein [Egbenema bharatensis]|uniref:hypothetical protein n=1 Tax=Egbenema bharatensis TaxID=3463334 RepID=UPI003A862ABB